MTTTFTAGQKLRASDLSPTTGVWTPALSGWTLSGTWTGTYRRDGDEVTVNAAITLTAQPGAWPTTQADSFFVTGLPYTVSMGKGASAYCTWGLRSWVAYAFGTTLNVSIVDKTSGTPSSGSNITITANYFTDDPV